MLREDYPGGRVLSLRRRRSRLPWIYLVYQEGERGEARPLPVAPDPVAAAREASPPAAEMPAHRTPRARPARYRLHL